ncbi:uncharacterized protein LOC123678511 [Harmonia axyridis]|uniref:uncharacterized protein LOC123678511 n=1 Tax=Harmonia axyridis TaxID=115357 RepID=UPI001E278683|nr:uncharacterized protein LOC123678511 [Harmonia axyridis]
MVVVIDGSIMKNYVGNNLKIDLGENSDPLTFVGNNIRVKIKKNEGNIDIVGDNCKVDVHSGSGSINYTGNNGKFNFGEAKTERKFRYNGNNVYVESPRENRDNPNKQQPSDEKNRKKWSQYGHCGCNGGTNIVISNTNHVRINSSMVQPRTTNTSDSSRRKNV